jgi:hypothetical protein
LSGWLFCLAGINALFCWLTELDGYAVFAGYAVWLAKPAMLSEYI